MNLPAPKTGNEIVSEAFEIFDAWCRKHADELEGLDTCERAMVYRTAMEGPDARKV